MSDQETVKDIILVYNSVITCWKYKIESIVTSQFWNLNSIMKDIYNKIIFCRNPEQAKTTMDEIYFSTLCKTKQNAICPICFSSYSNLLILHIMHYVNDPTRIIMKKNNTEIGCPLTYMTKYLGRFFSCTMKSCILPIYKKFLYTKHHKHN